MIKLYLANLGKYNEGILKGEWVELPLSETELEEVMVNIGVAHYDKEGNFVPYVIETDEKERIISQIEKLDIEITDQRKYGRANLIFVKPK